VGGASGGEGGDRIHKSCCLQQVCYQLGAANLLSAAPLALKAMLLSGQPGHRRQIKFGGGAPATA